MKQAESIWAAYVAARAKLEAHKISAPTRVIKGLHKRVRVTVRKAK